MAAGPSYDADRSVLGSLWCYDFQLDGPAHWRLWIADATGVTWSLTVAADTCPDSGWGAAAGPLAPASSAHVAMAASDLTEQAIRYVSTFGLADAALALVAMWTRGHALGRERWFLDAVDKVGTWVTRLVVLSVIVALAAHASGGGTTPGACGWSSTQRRPLRSSGLWRPRQYTASRAAGAARTASRERDSWDYPLTSSSPPRPPEAP